MRSTEALPAFRTAPSPERAWAREWRLAGQDLSRCFKGWQVWALLGVSAIRLRYKRSRFGQFWITLSMAFFVAGIGAVYGGLFHQNVHDYIPYLAVNMTIWTLISTTISESCQAFIEAAPYLRQEALPKSTFIMRVMVRNVMAFGHNLIIIPLVFLIFLYAPSPVAFLAIPGWPCSAPASATCRRSSATCCSSPSSSRRSCGTSSSSGGTPSTSRC